MNSGMIFYQGFSKETVSNFLLHLIKRLSALLFKFRESFLPNSFDKMPRGNNNRKKIINNRTFGKIKLRSQASFIHR